MKAYAASMFDPIVCARKCLFTVEVSIVSYYWHVNQYFSVLSLFLSPLSLSLFPSFSVLNVSPRFRPSLVLSVSFNELVSLSLSLSRARFSSSAFLLASLLFGCFSSFVPGSFYIYIFFHFIFFSFCCCCRHFVIAPAKTVTLLWPGERRRTLCSVMLRISSK